MSNESKGDEVVVLAEFESELEAGFAASRLTEAGIVSRTVGGATAGFRAEAPGRVRVLVHANDAERARALLTDD